MSIQFVKKLKFKVGGDELGRPGLAPLSRAGQSGSQGGRAVHHGGSAWQTLLAFTFPFFVIVYLKRNINSKTKILPPLPSPRALSLDLQKEEAAGGGSHHPPDNVSGENVG